MLFGAVFRQQGLFGGAALVPEGDGLPGVELGAFFGEFAGLPFWPGGLSLLAAAPGLAQDDVDSLFAALDADLAAVIRVAAEIAEAMDGVLQDSQLRHQLRHQGLARAAEFSWERCARETLAVYESVLRVT